MKNLLFTSLDNKFCDELISAFKNEYNVKTDFFGESEEGKRQDLLDWADIIFSEWCESNAVWYSKHKRPNQKLFIRVHRYELFSENFYSVNWPSVDNLIFISPELKRLANKLLLQRACLWKYNFDWQFYLNSNPTFFSNLEQSNYNLKWAWQHWLNHGSRAEYSKPLIELKSMYFRRHCKEFKHFNGGEVIFNYVKSSMFKNIPKEPGYEFNLGLMGILPKLKRPDIALDLIESLIQKNNRYRLHILSKHYLEWHGTAKLEHERNYYRDFFERINNSHLKNFVIFENYSDSPEIWLSKIGYILSTSDIEGSHQAIAEGMATGSIPIIFGSALTRYKLDEIYPQKYCFYQNDIETLSNQIITFTHDTELRMRESEYCKQYIHDRFRLELIKKEYDKLFATGSALNLM